MVRKKAKAFVPSAQSSRLVKQSAVSTQHSVKAKTKPTPKTGKPGDRSQKSGKPEPRSRKRFFYFPEVAGKVLEGVEFATTSGYDAISLSFRDNTSMDFVIDTCFTVKADYLDRGRGDHRVLKKWPLMRSQGCR